MSETADEPPVRVAVDDGAVWITLNRPEKQNALTSAVRSGIMAALDDAEDRDEARCVVITGAGGTFCAGGDVNEMDDTEGQTPANRVGEIRETLNRLVERVARFPLPTIAVVEGVAFGGGTGLALACDVRLARADARIGFGFRQVGLTADSGISYFLPRMVGRGTAKALLLSGDILEADRASELGLFERVYETSNFDTEVSEFVHTVATGPTQALTHSMRLLDTGAESPLQEALNAESTAQAVIAETFDHEEGVTAFAEGREPEFDGR